MHLRFVPAAAVAALIVSAVAACNSDRAYAPPDTVLTDQQVSRDVAVSAGEATSRDLDLLGSSADLLGGTFSVQVPTDRGASLEVVSPTSAPCTYSTGRWSCPPVIEKGLTIVRSYAFFDAAGQPMKVRDDLTTASTNFQRSVNGSVSRDTTYSGVVHHTRNETVSGLLGRETTRRWDGFGASADTNTHHSGTTTRTYAGTALDSLKAVVYPQPRTSASYPLSGTAVHVVRYLVTSTGRSTERRSVDRRVVVTYNGTAAAQMQVGTVTCTLHLDTHRVDGCSG